jgi:WXG100 family type VII secretion target
MLTAADVFDHQTLASLAAKAKADARLNPRPAGGVMSGHAVDVDTEGLRTAADQYGRLHQSAVTLADNLRECTSDLMRVWQGPAATTFLQAQQQLEEHLRQVAERLERTANALTAIRESYRRLDEQVRAADEHLSQPS